jgi:PKD repeat protein
LVNLSGIPSPTFTYTNDRDLHEVNLSATGESAPLANFSSDKINGTAPLSVQFTNLTIGAATNWLWNFGDGNSSTLQNPSHTYASKGVYTVSLTATGSAGSTTETKQNYITVYDGAIANFTASDTNGVAPLAIDFTNTSTGDYSTSFWAFGDGSTSTQANPSHTYLTSGVYSVSLIVSGLGSSDSEIKTNYITVNQPVSADFAANTTNGIAPLLVDFNNESTGDYSSYNWTFGDGATSIQANPSHTYLTSGTYSVSFTVSGSGGSDTETKTNYITVYQPVSANFSATPTSGKQPFLVRFTNTSLGDYDTVFWDFGDGGSSLEQNPDHLYITNGIFTVSLTISGNGGTDEVIKMGYIVVNDLNYIFLPMLLR